MSRSKLGNLLLTKNNVSECNIDWPNSLWFSTPLVSRIYDSFLYCFLPRISLWTLAYLHLWLYALLLPLSCDCFISNSSICRIVLFESFNQRHVIVTTLDAYHVCHCHWVSSAVCHCYKAAFLWHLLLLMDFSIGMSMLQHCIITIFAIVNGFQD